MKGLLISICLIIFSHGTYAQNFGSTTDNLNWVNYSVNVHVTKSGVLEVQEDHDIRVNGNIDIIRRIFKLPRPGSIVSMEITQIDIINDKKIKYENKAEAVKGNFKLSPSGILNMAIRSPGDGPFDNKILHFSIKYEVTNTFEKKEDFYVFRFPFFIDKSQGLTKSFRFNSSIDEKAWEAMEIIPKNIARSNLPITDPFQFNVRLKAKKTEDVDKVFSLKDQELLLVCPMTFNELVDVVDVLIPGTPKKMIRIDKNKNLSLRLVIKKDGIPIPVVSTFGPDAYPYVVPSQNPEETAMLNAQKTFFNRNYSSAKEKISKWLGGMIIGVMSKSLLQAEGRSIPMNISLSRKKHPYLYDMRITNDRVSVKIGSDKIILSEIETQKYNELPLPKSFKFLLQSSVTQGQTGTITLSECVEI